MRGRKALGGSMVRGGIDDAGGRWKVQERGQTRKGWPVGDRENSHALQLALQCGAVGFTDRL